MSLLPKVLDKKKTLSEKDADKMPQLQCQSILPPPINIEGRDGLLEPYNYLRPNTGKDMKMKLLSAFDSWMHVPKEYMLLISRMAQIVHRAGLLIDDIQDDTELRRGVAAAHKLYGVPLTMGSAYYALFLMLSELQILNQPDMIRICIDEITNLHYGQGIEIYFRDTFVCHTEDEYVDMVNAKTGALLILGIRLMQSASNSTIDYTPLVYKIGLYLQIRNDYLNLCSKDYTDNQGFCTDIEEGKFSFPIIHSINSTPRDHQLLNILKQRSRDVDLKKLALGILVKTDSFRYCCNYLRKLERSIRKEITSLGGNKQLETIIDAISVRNEAIYID